MRNGIAGDLTILESPQAVAQAIADAFVTDAQDAIAQRGQFSVALSGGSTPKSAYALLGQSPRRDQVDWQRVQIFFGDERCVPPQDEQSNYKMAHDAFLRAVSLPEVNVHRIHGEDDPQKAAADYAALLVEKLGNPPRFDLVMLGMGTDGHTASLFPGTDPRQDEDRLVRSVHVEKLQSNRITITPVVINFGRHVIVATEGVSKAPALYAVIKGPYDPTVHPIQIIALAAGRLSWYVDRAAAAELSAA